MRSSLSCNNLKEIRARYIELKEAEPRLRARDAAEKLGCTEAELIAAGCGVDWAWHLNADSLMKWLPQVAELPGWMWLLRNGASVLEKDASATRLVNSNGRHHFEGESFAVDIQANRVGYVFYACFNERLPRAIQVFDQEGQAILKLYLKDKSVADQADQTIGLFKTEMPIALELAAPIPAPSLPEAAAGETLPSGSYDALIRWAADAGEEISLTASNAGGSMTVSLVPERIKPMPEWFNILDRGFNLHLMETPIARASYASVAERIEAHYFGEDGTRLLTIELPAVALNALEL